MAKHGNWNVQPEVRQAQEDETHRADMELTAQRVTRVVTVARQLFELLDRSRLSADERIAARQLFNVLYDRLGGS